MTRDRKTQNEKAAHRERAMTVLSSSFSVPTISVAVQLVAFRLQLSSRTSRRRVVGSFGFDASFCVSVLGNRHPIPLCVWP